MNYLNKLLISAFLVGLCVSQATAEGIQKAGFAEGFEPEPPPKALDANGYPSESVPTAQEIRETQEQIKREKEAHRKERKIDPAPKCEGFFKTLPQIEENIQKLEKERLSLLFNEDGSPRILDPNEQIRLKQLIFNIEKIMKQRDDGIEFCSKVLGAENGKCFTETADLEKKIKDIKEKIAQEIEASAKATGAEREKHTKQAAKLGEEVSTLEAQRAQKESDCGMKK